VDNLSAVIGGHIGLAAIETAAGRLDDAAAHITTAASLKPETAHSWDVALLIARADLALAHGDEVEALRFSEAAAAIENASTHGDIQALFVLRSLGDAQLVVGKADEAVATYQKLSARASAAHAVCRLAEGHEGAAAAAIALGKPDDAQDHLAAATTIRQRTRSRRLPRPGVDRLLSILEAEPIASATS
jgi:hypothetical protein